MSAQPGTGPLSGARVLDLTWGMAGAFATMLLADYGAEVVKVERPGGDPARRAGALRTWDRGKRSIVLDLTDPSDLEVARSLAAGADVVVSGFRPGRLAALGIDEAACRTANPGLVWCELTGYGSTPDAAEHEGVEVLAAAHLGVMAESPGHRDGPIFPGHPALAYGTGFVAAIGTLAALRARLVTGLGDRVEVSFVDGVLASMGMNWWSERNLSYIAAKSRTGALDMGRRRMLLRRYECSDGALVQVHTGAAGAFGRAMHAFGLDDVISKAEGPVETASELTDRDLEILATELPRLFRTKTSREWMELLWAHEVACLPLQPPGLVFDDEQIRHAGVMTRVDDPELGPIDVVGAVIRFADAPGSVRGPSPVLDQDGDALRRDGWASPGLGAAGTARTDGVTGAPLAAPLDGVRIAEFSNWFASPYGNRILSDLGADVVKVEAVQGDPIRPLPDPCEGANRGKRSLAIDLKADAARGVLRRLIAASDIVQHNLRPGAAERLGIDYESARAMNPRLVYGYAPGYGSSGPKSRLQSFAPLLSGFVGVNHLAAGEGNDPHGSFGNEDYYNGLLSATALLLALIHRERTGSGQYVESPQLHSSLVTTSEWFLREGVPTSALPTLDHDQMGWGATYRVYQCLTGWIAVGCTAPAHADALRSTVDGATGEGPALAAALTDAFFGAPAGEWCERLRAAGVPCEVVREDAWLAEFLLDDENVKAGRALEIDHPIHGRARAIGALVHLRDRPVPAGGRSPLLGEHSDEVVRELGFAADEVERLQADGVLRITRPS